LQKKRVKKPASKKPKVRHLGELEIHMHCAKWLRDAYPQLLAFHVANERKASVQYHVKLKRMGVLSGVADFLVFPNDERKIAIELKDDEGKQDADQIKFQKRWEHSGGTYFLVRTVVEFQSIISALMLFS
jgi:hypothetical protein